MNKAVFLDRDGTMNEDVGYLDRIERLALFPWAVDAVRMLNHAGFKIVVVTNQAGVSQGLFDEAFVRDLHRHIGERFEAGRARIDGFYYCPHHPAAAVAQYRTECGCRKPAPGLVQAAARDLDLDLARSFVVGDRWLDMRLATNVGARPVLVRTGYGRSEEGRPPADLTPAFVGDDLMAATCWILEQDRQVASTRPNTSAPGSERHA